MKRFHITLWSLIFMYIKQLVRRSIFLPLIFNHLNFSKSPYFLWIRLSEIHGFNWGFFDITIF